MDNRMFLGEVNQLTGQSALITLQQLEPVDVDGTNRLMLEMGEATETSVENLRS